MSVADRKQGTVQGECKDYVVSGIIYIWCGVDGLRL